MGRWVGGLVGGGVLNLRTAFPKGSLVAEKRSLVSLRTISARSAERKISIFESLCSSDEVLRGEHFGAKRLL